MKLFVLLQLYVAGATALAVFSPLQQPLNWLLGSGVQLFPHPHPAPGRTIYETIRNDYRFTKLTKALDFVGGDVVSTLNDTSHAITFFAVPDDALQPPPHRRHGKKEDSKDLASLTAPSVSDDDIHSLLFSGSLDFHAAISALEEMEAEDSLRRLGDGDEEPEDPEKERRKKIMKIIIHAVLNYHILPDGAYDVHTLSKNTTFPTNFQVPVVLGGRQQRIKVFRKPGLKSQLTLNLYAKVKVADIKAENGLIHVVDHPLLPPIPIFQELFLAQSLFSTFTSAIQRTGLTGELDLRYIPADGETEGHFDGTTATTVFAVKNKAFNRLPPRLRLFLFSPFGTKVLRRLLEYHIVPGVVAHADWLFNQTAGTVPELSKACTCPEMIVKKGKHPKKLPPHFEPISTVNATLDTRLHNHTVEWFAEKFVASIPLPHGRKIERFATVVLANRRPVHIPDVVGLNGAIHVLDRLLVPYHCGHGHPGHGHPDHPGDHDGGETDKDEEATSVAAEWEGWEAWLPQWAEQC